MGLLEQERPKVPKPLLQDFTCLTDASPARQIQKFLTFLDRFLPDVDEKQLSLVGELPSFQDITLDPATAYEKLTGTYDEKVSENTVL